MASVRDHYDTVLSAHYSRMFGEFDAKVAEQQHVVLERLGVTARNGTATAVDLGCGSGFQSGALARLGFEVLAIDFSQRLLAELRDPHVSRSQRRAVRAGSSDPALRLR
jgi:2-polyprenyl-3-methyl-5-hydroxy-6-metoxy-1,4-benzoquinol methylase